MVAAPPCSHIKNVDIAWWAVNAAKVVPFSLNTVPSVASPAPFLESILIKALESNTVAPAEVNVIAPSISIPKLALSAPPSTVVMVVAPCSAICILNVSAASWSSYIVNFVLSQSNVKCLSPASLIVTWPPSAFNSISAPASSVKFPDAQSISLAVNFNCLPLFPSITICLPTSRLSVLILCLPSLLPCPLPPTACNWPTLYHLFSC